MFAVAVAAAQRVSAAALAYAPLAAAAHTHTHTRAFASSSAARADDDNNNNNNSQPSASSSTPSVRDRLRRFTGAASSSSSSSSPSSSSSSYYRLPRRTGPAPDAPGGSSLQRTRTGARRSRPPFTDSAAAGAAAGSSTGSYSRFNAADRTRSRRAPPAAGQASDRFAPGARRSSAAGSADRGPSGPRDTRRRGTGARSSRKRGPTSILPFEQWIKGPIAARYKETPTTKGPHWIGDTPFPLNPSFRPPAPIHARVKDQLWRLHEADPATYTVRILSQQFSIGIPRVEAILRLKALEADLVKQGFPLQTDFQSKMDRLLGSELRTNLNPEHLPVPQRKDHSPRGQIWEDSSELDAAHEGDANSSGSVLAPALAAIEAKRAAAVRALPNRGVDPLAIAPPRTLRARDADKVAPTAVLNPSPAASAPALQPVSTSSSSSSKTGAAGAGEKTKRAVLTIVNVSGRSYEGDGRIARNQKRAAKRNQIKAKQRLAREAAAAAAAAGPDAVAVAPLRGKEKRSVRGKNKRKGRQQAGRRAVGTVPPPAPLSGTATTAAPPSTPAP